MSTPNNRPDEFFGDAIVILLARVMAAANKRAIELGVDAGTSIIAIAQRPEDGKTVWRINYGAKAYIGRRGGDLVIDVNPADCSIERVLRGQ